MRLLLDSHILLWTVFEPEKLSPNAHDVIADKDNLVCISIASLWEISIKRSIGRLSIPDGFFDAVIHESGFSLLLIQPAHIMRYGALPLYHRDPFDRMLVAQAQEEQLTLLSHDEELLQYDVALIR